MDQSKWFEQELLPKMASAGSFGASDFQVMSCTIASLKLGDDHFTSDTFFINVKIKRPDETSENHDMLVKLTPNSKAFRDYMQTEIRFFNETLLYTEVVPNIEKFVKTRGQSISPDYDVFPKCYYANCTEEEGVVVLEDLRPHGFSVCEERVVLDYDHCLILIEALGRFHAISYAMKEITPSSFFPIMQKFKQFDMGEGDFFKITLSRVTTYLERTQELDMDTFNRFKERIKEPMKMYLSLLEPQEPLAVLCHGDFCRNNVFFKYDNDKKPIDVKFFDFQAAKYASPAIDLTFFIFMNTTSDFRNKHLNTMLTAYHRALLHSLVSILGRSEEELGAKYPFELFQKEFRDYAYYGLMICSFFLPQMLIRPEDQLSHEQMEGKTQEENALLCNSKGGDEATAVVADIVKDMAKIGSF
ncbi:hypothetical protein C0J52_06682 [Blattella germanica]|nr:hypothetical protein C0J52_06682 [Blattella germanica]